MKMLRIILSFSLLLSAWGFLPASHLKNGRYATLQMNISPDDLPPPMDDGEYSGNVDWDAEWKKVVSDQGKQKKRPDPKYKSEAEIAVIKAVNKVAKKTVDASNQVPNIRIEGSLTSDWRFWIGILVFLSVATSLLTAPPPINVQDSYYI